MDFVSAKFILVAVVLVFFFVYWVFNFVILYHLVRFGIGTQPKRLAMIFLVGSVALFFICTTLFSSIDMSSFKHRLEKLITEVLSITYQKQ